MEQLEALGLAIPVAGTPSPFQFLLFLLLGLALSSTLGWVYRHCGESLSNRSKFASNFFVVTACTLVIITLIRSSLALSLGLVGALSIVRYRAAIKEPEELGYLFISVMLGLGLGAGQAAITLIAFAFIVGTLALRSLFRRRAKPFDNLYITVRHEQPPDGDLVGRLTGVLRTHCGLVDLRRFDSSDTFSEAAFLVDLKSVATIDPMVAELRGIGPNLQVTLVDNRGLV